MKKRILTLVVMLFVLLIGGNQVSLSKEKALEPIPVTNYLEIMNASNVCGMADIIVRRGHTTVTIYNYNNQVVESFYAPYAGIYPTYLNEPKGRYKAVLTGYNINETDYFTIVCDPS